VISKASPAIVMVTATQHEERKTSKPSKAIGAGFFIDKRGYLVTSQRVIADANSIEVTTNSGKKMKAKLIGFDSRTEIAVLKVDAEKPLPVLTFADAENIKLGQSVVAIGNLVAAPKSPFSLGVITAIDREIRIKQNEILILLQSDAELSPGSSGSPLLNFQGEVVGMSVSIRVGSQPISYAVPIDVIIRISNTLIENDSDENDTDAGEDAENVKSRGQRTTVF